MKASVIRQDDAARHDYGWGSLTWFASGTVGGARDMTVGLCVIKPGCENPAHAHPNCEEVLHLVRGTIAHTADDETYSMLAGDTIVVPPDVRHNARNVGRDDAVMYIAFSSAEREMVSARS